MNDRATVFVVDDDPAVRDSLTLLIELEGLAAQSFESAEAFLAACPIDVAGCAVVDVRMPGMDGIHFQEELTRRGYRLPIIFLTGHGDIPTTVRAIKAGAADFLTKPITAEALLASVRVALEQGRRLSAEAEANHSAASSLTRLTEREREVMALAILGNTNKEIARHLGISHRTVEIHKARLMHKTGAASVLELARLAEASGLR